MDIKHLAVLFVVLLSVVPVSAADNTSLNPQAAGANMVQAGFDLVIRSLADGIIMIWQAPGKIVNSNFDNTTIENINHNESVTEKYGETRASIMTFVSINVQPDKIKAVQDVEDKTTPIWLLLVVFYILDNPIRNILARAGYHIYSSTFDTPNLSGEKYIGTVILLLCSYATPNIVLILIQACILASSYFMLSVMDYIEPSIGNAWLYLFMAIGETILAIFFIIRPWVICVVYAVCKLLAVWYLIGVWRGEITWVWSRFFKILTLQPVVVFITCICLIGMKWSHFDQSPGAYLIMFFMLFYICYKWMTGNFDLPGKLTRLAVRRAL
jgi:hypothetical protein